MNVCVQDYAARPAVFRGAIEEHREWIESKLGVPLSEAVVLATDVDLNLAQIAGERILGYQCIDDAGLMRRLGPRVETVEVPTYLSPILSLHNASPKIDLVDLLSGSLEAKPMTAEWEYGPEGASLVLLGAR